MPGRTDVMQERSSSRISRVQVAVAGIVLALVVAGLVAWRVPVSDPVTRSQPYRLVTQVPLTVLSPADCATVELTGTARATLRTSVLGTSIWSAATIEQGAVNVGLATACTAGAAPAELGSVSIIQNWAIGSALAEPSTSRHTDSGSTFSQYNSGNQMRIGGGTVRGGTLCFTPRTQLEASLELGDQTPSPVAALAFPDVCLNR